MTAILNLTVGAGRWRDEMTAISSSSYTSWKPAESNNGHFEKVDHFFSVHDHFHLLRYVVRQAEVVRHPQVTIFLNL